MKTYFQVLTTLSLMLFLAACSSGSGSSNNNATTTPYIVSCPAGSTNQNNSCVTPNGTVVSPIGTVGTTGGMYGYYTDNWDGQNLLTITDQTNYNYFLRDAMGACDHDGMDSCSSWDGAPFDIVVQSSSPTTALQVTFRARPPEGGTGPMGFVLNMPTYLTNNSKGFEARSYGPSGTAAYKYLFQLQVAVGVYGNATIPYRLAYNGVIIAQGTLNSCTSAACGLSNNIGNY